VRCAMIRISSGAGKRPAREFVPAEGLHSARARGTPASSGQPRETQSRQSGANPAEPPFRERGKPTLRRARRDGHLHDDAVSRRQYCDVAPDPKYRNVRITAAREKSPRILIADDHRLFASHRARCWCLRLRTPPLHQIVSERCPP